MSRTPLILALALLALAMPARALAIGASTYDPLASGKTKIHFEATFLATLKRNGVKLSATKPTRFVGGALTLPVSGGEFDPTIEKGTIEADGGAVFTAAGNSAQDSACGPGGRRTKQGKDAGREGRGAHADVRDPTRATEDTALRSSPERASSRNLTPLRSERAAKHLCVRRRQVVLRDLMLKIKPAPLYAKVGGGQLKLAGNARTRVTRDGFGADFSATRLRLTSKFATRLNKKLGLYRSKPFKPGMPLARITTTFQPQSVNVLPQGRAGFAPDPAILARLHELHVSLNPIAPAELAPGPLFSFPIAVTSRLSPDGRSGVLKTEGALEFLQLGAGQVFWKNPLIEPVPATSIAEVDVEPAPPFPGKLGPLPIAALDLAPATIVSEPKARTIAINGAHLALSAQSAATFNQAFAEGKPIFTPGEALGAVSFTAQGQ